MVYHVTTVHQLARENTDALKGFTLSPGTRMLTKQGRSVSQQTFMVTCALCFCAVNLVHKHRKVILSKFCSPKLLQADVDKCTFATCRSPTCDSDKSLVGKMQADQIHWGSHFVRIAVHKSLGQGGANRKLRSL